MRSVQRGISTLFLVVGILGITIAVVSTYFIFSQNLSQKAKSVDSFETCAKYYPVMESYPEQCNTPDGKHFTRQLFEEEQEKLKPIESLSPQSSTEDSSNSANLDSDIPPLYSKLKWNKSYKSTGLFFKASGDKTLIEGDVVTASFGEVAQDEVFQYFDDRLKERGWVLVKSSAGTLSRFNSYVKGERYFIVSLQVTALGLRPVFVGKDVQPEPYIEVRYH